MASAEKQVVMFEIDRFTFVDHGADGVFNIDDSVVCAEAGDLAFEGEGMMLSAIAFVDLLRTQGMPADILGMSYAQ